MIPIARRPFKKVRRFYEEVAFYKGKDKYYLLPFRFMALNDQKEVLVNELGDSLLVPLGTAARVIRKQIDRHRDEKLYADLISHCFISEEAYPPLLDTMASRYRSRKSFLDHFTALHIFVITLRCEHSCHYCQVSRISEDKNTYDMSWDYIDKGIALMMQSPNPRVTMEFQGGEALLAFDQIAYAIEQARIQAILHHQEINYVICTNLTPITDQMLFYFEENDVLIATSLDGPEALHNANRQKKDNNSYQLTISGIQRCREVLGNNRIAARPTTSALSLAYPNEMVDEYHQQGFDSIFLRPISPFGFARRNERKNKQEMELFLAFYKQALHRIIQYNRNGIFYREDYATIILKKILTPAPVADVALTSPAGIINKVILFNYDGKVYASDEARMLAELQDETFLLGHLNTHSYKDIFYSQQAREMVEAGINESLPGCADCAFQAYCGADPVFNHATQGDMRGYRPTNLFCQKNMDIIRHLLLLMDGDQEVKRIFHSWVNS